MQDLAFPAQGHSVLPKELIEWCQRAFGKAAFHMEICLSAKCSRKRNQETQGGSALSSRKNGFFCVFMFRDRCNTKFLLPRPDIGTECIQAVSCRPDVPRQAVVSDRDFLLSERCTNQQPMHNRFGRGNPHVSEAHPGKNGLNHMPPPAIPSAAEGQRGPAHTIRSRAGQSVRVSRMKFSYPAIAAHIVHPPCSRFSREARIL